MIILGIETSCDETALALIETRDVKAHNKNSVSTEYRVIQALVHSQAELHSNFGGVFPALAKREHSKNLIPLLEKILKDLPSKHQIQNEGFAKKLEEIKVNVQKAIENIYRNFDEKKYYGILKSYYHLEKKYEFYSPLVNEYQKFLHDNIKAIISNTFEAISKEYKLDLVINISFI